MTDVSQGQRPGSTQPNGYGQQQNPNVRPQVQPISRKPQSSLRRAAESTSLSSGGHGGRRSARLGLVHVLNAVAYVANAFISYGVGTFGMFGLATNATVWATYPSLVTPSIWTFHIMIVILMFQLAWVVVQLLPDFRTIPLVTAVGWNFIFVCASQIGWTIAFGYQVIWLSLLAALVCLVFLFLIFSAQSTMGATVDEFFALKFPFSLAYGWIIAEVIIIGNVLLVSLEVAESIQFYMALASVSALMLVGCATSDLIVLVVLAWTTIGIWAELSNSNNPITGTFDYTYIMWLKRWTLVCFFVIVLLFVVRAFLAGRERRSKKVQRRDNESDYKSMGDVSEITF